MTLCAPSRPGPGWVCGGAFRNIPPDHHDGLWLIPLVVPLSVDAEAADAAMGGAAAGIYPRYDG